MTIKGGFIIYGDDQVGKQYVRNPKPDQLE